MVFIVHFVLWNFTSIFFFLEINRRTIIATIIQIRVFLDNHFSTIIVDPDITKHSMVLKTFSESKIMS